MSLGASPLISVYISLEIIRVLRQKYSILFLNYELFHSFWVQFLLIYVHMRGFLCLDLLHSKGVHS
jgi:hypothetical protein